MTGKSGETPPEITGISTVKKDPRFLRLLKSSIEDSSDDKGWAELGLVGNNLQKKRPEFDARNYGFRKFFDLIQSLGLFDIDERQSKDQSGKIIYIREKVRKGRK